MGELAKLLPNIGNALEEQLNAVGIQTVQQLKKLGSKQAWQMIKNADHSACLTRLYALEGAIQGIRWHKLDDGIKEELMAFYASYQKEE